MSTQRKSMQVEPVVVDLDSQGASKSSSTDLGIDEKKHNQENPESLVEKLPRYDEEEIGGVTEVNVASSAEDLVTSVIYVGDDPSVNPWTFRMWFLGIGLSLFSSVLAEIYYFKPQTILVSTVFLAVISYVLGEALAAIIPTRGFIGRWFNPHKFNHKEHAAIIIMSSAAATCALGTEVLAVQKLWYGSAPNPGVCIFILLSSQFLGYGIAGFLRSTIVYPTRMLFPKNLPISTLLETLYRNKSETSTRLKVFYIGFATLFVWELFPEYIFPWTTGISVFCLADKKSSLFTNLFGGSNGNEGLGLLSICLDWNYISGSQSPLWFPLQTLNNGMIGYIACIGTFMYVYYGNVWNAQDFAFLSQLLFSTESNSTNPVTYNQTAVIGSDNFIDPAAVAVEGLPQFTATYITYLITTNMAITATFSHMLLWNRGDLREAWSFASMANLKRMEDLDKLDPHYRLMLAYNDVPNWWYGLTLVLSVLIALACLYSIKTTLPWWGFLVACAVSAVCSLFFTAQYGLTGLQFITQPIIQMLGGYLHPEKPLANMYFTLYGYNSVSQAQLLLQDLKLAQYAKLSPRCTFTAQFVGTCVGAILNYIMMESIVTNQRDILLSVEGTNVWSGQNIQQYNSQPVAWGGFARELFSAGSKYQWLRLNYWNTAIISYYTGYLFVGINSSLLTYFVVGYFLQFYLRKYKAAWFIKYNYLLSAAMDGGTQVCVFMLTFAVAGGSGVARPFPKWWGNNPDGNFDYCQYEN